jgi:hypothetical protein
MLAHFPFSLAYSGGFIFISELAFSYGYVFVYDFEVEVGSYLHGCQRFPYGFVPEIARKPQVFHLFIIKKEIHAIPA